MSLTHLVKIRSQVKEYEEEPYGFKGQLDVLDSTLLHDLNSIDESTIREMYRIEDSDSISLSEVKLGDEISIAIDLSTYSNYYESIDDFLSSNKFSTINEVFYINELKYLNGESQSNLFYTKYLKLQEHINFLTSIATHHLEQEGRRILYFQKYDNLLVLDLNYDQSTINGNEFNSISDLKSHIDHQGDHETRKKLYTIELINLLDERNSTLNEVIKSWDQVEMNYRKSHQVYLEEFSFNKIKTSSQEYFHELTDRIYSTIHKFSGYILAIPIAYVFILRYFDFNGKSFQKDTFLLLIGLLYFIVIWFVLLRNLSMAFKVIEDDISKFMDRIKNELSLSEIHGSLQKQVSDIIPIQERKITIVKTISLLILGLIIFAYCKIYFLDQFAEFLKILFYILKPF